MAPWAHLVPGLWTGYRCASPRGCVPPRTLCPSAHAGFIDFIVEPTFSVLTDVAERMVLPLPEDGTKAKGNPAGSQQPRLASASPQGGGGGGCSARPWGGIWLQLAGAGCRQWRCPRCQPCPVPAAASGGSSPWTSRWSWGSCGQTWQASAPPGASTSRRTSRSGRRGQPAVGASPRCHRGPWARPRGHPRGAGAGLGTPGRAAGPRAGWVLPGLPAWVGARQTAGGG